MTAQGNAVEDSVLVVWAVARRAVRKALRLRRKGNAAFSGGSGREALLRWANSIRNVRCTASEDTPARVDFASRPPSRASAKKFAPESWAMIRSIGGGYALDVAWIAEVDYYLRFVYFRYPECPPRYVPLHGAFVRLEESKCLARAVDELIDAMDLAVSYERGSEYWEWRFGTVAPQPDSPEPFGFGLTHSDWEEMDGHWLELEWRAALS